MSFDNIIDGQWSDTSATSVNLTPSDTSDVIGEFAHGERRKGRIRGAGCPRRTAAWASSTGQQCSEILDGVGIELLARSDLLARAEGKTITCAIAEVTRPTRS